MSSNAGKTLKPSQRWCSALCALFFLFSSGGTSSANDTAIESSVFPSRTWSKLPQEIIKRDLNKYQAIANRIGGSGFISIDGYQAHQWGEPGTQIDWASAFKPVMSTFLLFAIGEGKLQSTNTHVAPYLADVSYYRFRSADRNITFRQLANMTSGYGLKDNPGLFWAYNDYAMSLYATLLYKGVFDSHDPNIVANNPNRFLSLQFQDGNIFGGRRGNVGLYTSPRDAARIGLFWLNKGKWRERQLIPSKLFDTYMRIDVAPNMPRTPYGNVKPDDYLKMGTVGGGADLIEHGPGIYGNNWWFNGVESGEKQRIWPDAPKDIVMAMGHINKEVIAIFPTQRIVVAAAGDWGEFAPNDPSLPSSLNITLSLIADLVEN